MATKTDTLPAPKLTIDNLVTYICEKQIGVPNAGLRVSAYIKLKTGHPHLIAMTNSSLSEDEKMVHLKAIGKALAQYHKTKLENPEALVELQLEGEIAKAQAPIAEPDSAPVLPAQSVSSVFKKRLVVEKKVAEPEQSDAARNINAGADALKNALELLGVGKGSAQVDEDKVVEIVDEHLDGKLTSIVENLEGHFETFKKTFKVPPREVIEIREPNGDVREIKGRQHYKFPLLLLCLKARIPTILVGPAGSFKSTAVEKAAEALGLAYEGISVGPMTSKADLFGYMDANGNYHETALVRRAKNGGVFNADEVDAGNAGVMTGVNMTTANKRIPTPKGFEIVHDDFVFVGTANTYLLGGDRQYVGRNQLDAATVDRFAFIDWDYDEGAEAATIGLDRPSPSIVVDQGGIMSPDQWFDYVTRVRKACETLKVRHVISPRATINGNKLFQVGVGFTHVANLVLWKGMDKATREKVGAAM